MLQNSNSMQQSAAAFTIEHSDGGGGREDKQPSINFREAMEHVQQLKRCTDRRSIGNMPSDFRSTFFASSDNGSMATCLHKVCLLYCLVYEK